MFYINTENKAERNKASVQSSTWLITPKRNQCTSHTTKRMGLVLSSSLKKRKFRLNAVDALFNFNFYIHC